MTILDKYLKLYEKENWRTGVYLLSYNSFIEYLVEHEIYTYNGINIPNRDLIDQEIKNYIIKNTTIEIKLKLIPLILFIGEDYWRQLIKIDYFNEVHPMLLAEFKGLSFQVDLSKIHKFSYDYQRQKNLVKRIEEGDFEEIKKFNMEPTIGNHQYINFINDIAERYFFDAYCQALDNKDCLTFLFFLTGFRYSGGAGFEKSLSILPNLNKNKIILQAILFSDMLTRHTNDDASIIDTIISFSKNETFWDNFIQSYCKYPSQHPLLFKVLPKVIIQLDEKSLNSLLNGIEIDKYLQQDSAKALDNCFLKIQDDEKIKYCTEVLFQRWLKYIKNHEGYLGRIVLTNVVNIIVHYTTNFLTEDTVRNEVLGILCNISELDNKWFHDESAYLGYFYKQISILFIYIFPMNKYKFHDLIELTSDICNSSNILKKELPFLNEISTLDLFNKYNKIEEN